MSFFLFSYWYEHDHKFSRQQSQQRQPNSEVVKAIVQDLRVSDVKSNAEFTPANTRAARAEARATRANTTSVADLQAQVEAANAKATQAEARAKRAEDEVVRLKAQLKAPEIGRVTMSRRLFSVLHGFTTPFSRLRQNLYEELEDIAGKHTSPRVPPLPTSSIAGKLCCNHRHLIRNSFVSDCQHRQSHALGAPLIQYSLTRVCLYIRLQIKRHNISNAEPRHRRPHLRLATKASCAHSK